MSDYLTKNPCIDICKFRAGVCRACGRTKAEKKSWKSLPKAQRHAIWERILESHGAGNGKRAGALRKRYEKVSASHRKREERGG